MQAVLGSLPADNAVVLGLPDGDRLELRWEYPEKMDALVDAGVTAIGFDVLFLKNSDADVLFAEAIERAEAAGVEVILPRRFDGQDFLPISEALSQAGHSAMVILEEDLLFGTVRRLPARLVGASGERHWGLSSMLLAGHLGVGEPSWVGTDLAIGVTRNPTHSERLILPPVDAPRTVQWDSSFKEEGLEGKAVLIGAMQGHADALRTPSGHRYGVEIHAAAFETLARQRGLRVLPSWLEGFVAFLFAFGSWQLSQWFGRRGQRIAWLLPLGGLGLCAGALKAGWVLAVFPIWIGVGVGVWASKRL
jgi:CHASE2 domain-containing sensor protein